MRNNVYNVSRPSANLLPLDTDFFNHACSSQIIENPSHTMFITKTTFLVCGEKKKMVKIYIIYVTRHVFRPVYEHNSGKQKQNAHTVIITLCTYVRFSSCYQFDAIGILNLPVRYVVDINGKK